MKSRGLRIYDASRAAMLAALNSTREDGAPDEMAAKDVLSALTLALAAAAMCSDLTLGEITPALELSFEIEAKHQVQMAYGTKGGKA